MQYFGDSDIQLDIFIKIAHFLTIYIQAIWLSIYYSNSACTKQHMKDILWTFKFDHCKEHVLLTLQDIYNKLVYYLPQRDTQSILDNCIDMIFQMSGYKKMINPVYYVSQKTLCAVLLLF